jgi:hypothetical protein
MIEGENIKPGSIAILFGDPPNLPGEVGSILACQPAALELEYECFAGFAKAPIAKVPLDWIEFANEPLQWLRPWCLFSV